MADQTVALAQADPVEWRPALSPVSFALLLTAVALAATGQLLLKHGMNTAVLDAARDHAPLYMKAATSPFILLGLTVFAVSAVAWLATLSRVPLSIAYPFNALSLLTILIASTLLLHERTNIWTWIGTLLVISGLFIVVSTRAS